MSLPVVEFVLGGNQVRFVDWKGGASNYGTVAVLYDSDVQQRAIIDRPLLNWLPWGAFSIAGAFLVMAAISGWGRVQDCNRKVTDTLVLLLWPFWRMIPFQIDFTVGVGGQWSVSRAGAWARRIAKGSLRR